MNNNGWIIAANGEATMSYDLQKTDAEIAVLVKRIAELEHRIEQLERSSRR